MLVTEVCYTGKKVILGEWVSSPLKIALSCSYNTYRFHLAKKPSVTISLFRIFNLCMHRTGVASNRVLSKG